MLVRFIHRSHPEVAINTDNIWTCTFHEEEPQFEDIPAEIVIAFLNTPHKDIDDDRFFDCIDAVHFEFENQELMYDSWNKLCEIMGYKEI